METIPASDATGADPAPIGSRIEQHLRGLGSVYLRGRIYWIAYWWRAKKIRETSRSTKKADAIRLLKRRIQHIGKGRFIDPKSEERVQMEDLFAAVVTDYKNNNRRSLDTLEDRLIPLRAAFGLDRAVDVDEARIEKYKAQRLGSKTHGDRLIAPATVNRELAALRRAFTIGVKHKLISRAPIIELLVENNVREGFIEPAAFEVLVAALPEYLKDFARFGYLVGWRKSALRTLRWSDVDGPNRRVYLRRTNSKNSKPYVIVLTDELEAVVARRWEARSMTNRDGTVLLSEWVFHRDGEAIGDFRKAWQTACREAHVAGLHFHDLRRSAARNMDRTGRVSSAVAMKITGHATDSMWRRYRIVDEDDIERALKVTQEYVSQQAAAKSVPKIVAMSERRS